MTANRSNCRWSSPIRSVPEHHFYTPLAYVRQPDHRTSLFYTNLTLALGFAVFGLIATVIYRILGLPTEFVTPLG
jgi:hypothetical protein